MAHDSSRQRMWAVAALGACIPLAACPPPNSCAVGQAVPIPSADATDPSLSYQVQGRGGALVQAASGVTSPRELVMPPGGVTIVAEATDPEGIRKVTVVVIPITGTTARSDGATTCTRATAQVFTNADPGLVGTSGCTARTLTTSVTVSRTLTTAKDEVEERAELLVTGQNCGGRNTTIPYKELMPRP